METIKVGITSMGVWLPSQFEDAQKISDLSGVPLEVVRGKMGINRKCRAIGSDNINPSEMAIRAAQKALADIDPLSIDLLIWTGSEYKDFPVWSAGIYVQERLGLKNAFSFDASARCSSNVLGIKLAKSLMQTDSKINRVLLCGGHKTGDLVDYKDSTSRFLYNLADGGSAIVLDKTATNEVLETSIITDGSFSKDVIIKNGGTVNPISSEQVNQKQSLTCPDIVGMRERLAQKSLKNFLKVIKDAARSSMPERPIDYLSLLHMKKSAHDGILEPLELKAEQSIYLSEYGHFGAPDQVVSLGLAEKNSLLKTGDHVVLASAGIGYTWSAVSIRWDQPIFTSTALNDLKY